MAFQKWLSQGVTKSSPCAKVMEFVYAPRKTAAKTGDLAKGLFFQRLSTLDIQWLNFHHGKLAAGTQK